MNNKSESGVTLIALTITIIVLLIITSITITNGIKQLGLKKVNNLEADINSISTKITDYYLKNESLPIFQNPYINGKENFELLLIKNGSNSQTSVNPNDSGSYYVIDLSKIEGLTLNYGSNYKSWNESSSYTDLQDIYVINEVSHQIYFPYGIKYSGEYYFTNSITAESVDRIVSGDLNENWDFEVISAEQERVNNTLITLTANIELNLNEFFDKNSLKYLWTKEGDESNIREMEFSKFSLYEDKAFLKSKNIENTSEAKYLWIKLSDENGNEYLKTKEIKISSIAIKIPSQYQKVEYIESTGSQYIDTELKLNRNSGFYIDFVPENEVTTKNAPNYINAGGAGGNYNTRIGISVYKTTDNGELQFLNEKIDPKITKNERIKMSIINKVVTYNDESTKQLNPQNITTSNSLIIFGAHTDPIARFSTMKLYNLRLYDSNNIIRNFIPCYRKSDNVKGLYDSVEGVFYENKNNGDDFIAGEVVY